MSEQFYIIDIRAAWRWQKYITLWRPNNSNYAWPLPWAGKYDKETINAHPSYYCVTEGEMVRFPVPCSVVEELAQSKPDDGDIDGNVGPVIRNTEKMRRKLRAAAYVPVKETAK